ncbi:MAG: hypothetical protein VX985_00950, partial [SAR324 cluster bacterium]|nr:hypothetical protein [SAR324 cluster bacterium]
ADAIENTEISESVSFKNGDITSKLSTTAGIQAGDFSVTQTSDKNTKKLTTVEKSNAEKT